MTAEGTGRGRATLAATGAVLVFALVGYLWFSAADQRGPYPTAVAGSFGVVFDIATDPARVSVVDDLTLAVSDLSEDAVEVRVAVRLRNRGPQATAAGAVLLGVPPRAAIAGVRLRTSTSQATDAWSVPPSPRLGVTAADAALPTHLAGVVPDRATPAGALAGQPLTLLPGDPSGDRPVAGRLLRVPLPATPWQTLEIAARYTAPAGLLRRPDRSGEQAIAVELAGGADGQGPDGSHLRPVSDYAADRGAAHLRLELWYEINLSETRFESVPPPTALEEQIIVWSEDVVADGRLRVDGHVLDETTRYWREQLDVLALLLLGAVLGVIVDRLVGTTRSEADR